MLMVSCNWDKGGNEQIPPKLVERLKYSDGSSVTFAYNNGYVTNIDFSNGDSYRLNYDFANAYNWSIIIESNLWTSPRELKIENGYIKKLYKGQTLVSELDYDSYYNYNLTKVDNNELLATSKFVWPGFNTSINLPYTQTDSWYESDADMSSERYVSRRVITYSKWDASAANVLSYMNLLPLVFPEYSELTGIDKHIIAALGGLRTTYLPSSIKIETIVPAESGDEPENGDEADGDEGSEEDDNVSVSVRTFSYECDAKGYVTAVFAGSEERLERLFTVEYRTVDVAAGE